MHKAEHKTKYNAVLIKICVFFFIISNSIRTASANTDWPFVSEETLYYKLSYRGLLTSFILADLADVKLTFLADIKPPHAAADSHEKGHQFIVSINSEHYLKAELIHAVRYSYIATTDTALEKILFVEKIDRGKAQRHEFLWLDWKHKQTQLFAIDETQAKQNSMQKTTQNIPQFFDAITLSDQHRQHLVYKKSGDNISHSKILDPLSLIYSLRTKDHAQIRKQFIAVSDDIRQYKIEFVALEVLDVNGKSYQSHKYKIQTDENKQKSFYVWLSDNKKRIPLRFVMDAPLGYLKIDLVK